MAAAAGAVLLPLRRWLEGKLLIHCGPELLEGFPYCSPDLIRVHSLILGHTRKCRKVPLFGKGRTYKYRSSAPIWFISKLFPNHLLSNLV